MTGTWKNGRIVLDGPVDWPEDCRLSVKPAPEGPASDLPAEVKSTEDIAADPFIGLWQDRQDMADSGAWVRSLRRNEW